jgi:hypothetical protein
MGIIAVDCESCPKETNSLTRCGVSYVNVVDAYRKCTLMVSYLSEEAVQMRACDSVEPAVLALSNNDNPFSSTFHFIPFFLYRNLPSCDTLFCIVILFILYYIVFRCILHYSTVIRIPAKSYPSLVCSMTSFN